MAHFMAMTDEQSESVTIGTRVVARHQGGQSWYRAVVSRVRSDGTFDLVRLPPLLPSCSPSALDLIALPPIYVPLRTCIPLLACQPLSPGEVGPLARRKSMVGSVPQMRRPSTTLSNAATCYSKEKEPGGDWRRKLLPVTSQISTMHTTSKAAQIAKARRASGAYKEKQRCPAQGA